MKSRFSEWESLLPALLLPLLVLFELLLLELLPLELLPLELLPLELLPLEFILIPRPFRRKDLAVRWSNPAMCPFLRSAFHFEQQTINSELVESEYYLATQRSSGNKNVIWSRYESFIYFWSQSVTINYLLDFAQSWRYGVYQTVKNKIIDQTRKISLRVFRGKAGFCLVN